MTRVINIAKEDDARKAGFLYDQHPFFDRIEKWMVLGICPILDSGLALIVLRQLRCYKRYARSPVAIMDTCRFASLPSEAQYDYLTGPS
jgi:hypothetical protein